MWYGKKGDDIDKDVLDAWRKAGWIIRIEPDLPVKKKPEEEITVDTVDNKTAQVADNLAAESDLVEAVCEIEQQHTEEEPETAETIAEAEAESKDSDDVINSPSHYLAGGIETIDYIEAKGFNYNLGNVCKYISRAGHKGDTIEDLKKAAWYLNREISRLEKEAAEHARV